MSKKIYPLPNLPDPIVLTITKDGHAWSMEIPRAHADKPISSMPGMTPRMLHNATIKLS